jgi:hypothetical protein
MEMQHDDLPDTAEHRGPQAGAAASRWILAGWLFAGAFVAALVMRACWQ